MSSEGLTKRRRVGIVLATVMAVVAGGIIVHIAAGAQPKTWCGKSARSDWVCARIGHVYIGGKALNRHRPVQMRPKATVTAFPGALARVSFRRQARCVLGPTSGVTQIVTRSYEPNTLFRQLAGRTQCIMSRKQRSIGFFCGLTGNCPAVLTAAGEIIARTFGSSAARESEAGGPTKTRIVICSGFATVIVADPSGSVIAKASAGGSSKSRFVITLIETGNRIALSVSGHIPGRGACW